LNVIINKWDGEKFRYPHCTCWACGRVATVVEFLDENGGLLVRLCVVCLTKAMDVLRQETLRQHLAELPGCIFAF
jgi:hypothetical protein